MYDVNHNGNFCPVCLFTPFSWVKFLSWQKNCPLLKNTCIKPMVTLYTTWAKTSSEHFFNTKIAGLGDFFLSSKGFHFSCENLLLLSPHQ